MAGAECRAFHQPFALIGGHPGADLRLEQPEVGRRHAYLQAVAGRVFCLDLQSRTGIRWGEQPGSWGWLGPEGIRIGPYRIGPWEGEPWASRGDAAAADGDPPPLSRSFEQAGLAPAFLEFPDAAEKAAWRVSRTLVLVGRSPSCKIQMEGPETSCFHCSLVQTPVGVWVVDLLGSSGTFVNGRRVRSARLGDGDEIRVGGHCIRLRRGEPPASRHRRSSPLAIGMARPPDTAQPSNLDLVPVSEFVTGLAGRPNLPDSLLLQLFEQSDRMQQQMADRMQQQMADQFQRSLMMLFRMFGGMHEEQMALIRDELGRIQELIREQEVLQAEVAANSAIGTRPALRLIHGGEKQFPSSGGLPTEELWFPPCPSGGASTAPATGPERPRPTGGPSAEDAHAALVRRIAALQDQRQGRWQTILGAIMGKGHSEQVP